MEIETEKMEQEIVELCLEVVNSNTNSEKGHQTMDSGPSEMVDNVSQQIKNLSTVEFMYFYLKGIAKDSETIPKDEMETTNKIMIKDGCNNDSKLLKFVENIISENSKANVANLFIKMEQLSPSDSARLQRDVLKQTLSNIASTAHMECDKNISQAIVWIKTNVEEEVNNVIFKQELYTEYCNHCKNNKVIIPLSKKELEILIEQTYPSTQQIRVGKKGNWRSCYRGLKKRMRLYPPSLPKLKQEQTETNAKFLEISNHQCSTNSQTLSTNTCSNSVNTEEKLDGNQVLEEIANLSQQLVAEVNKSSAALNNENFNEIQQNNCKLLNALTEVDKNLTASVKVTPAFAILKSRINNGKIKKYKEFRHSSVHALTESYKNIIIPVSIYGLNMNPIVLLENMKLHNWYEKQLVLSRQRLLNMNIRKLYNTPKYRVKCMCCKYQCDIQPDHGMKLLQLKHRLLRKISLNDNHLCSKPLYNMKALHPSIRKIFTENSSIIIPPHLIKVNIHPMVKLDRNVVLSWYVEKVRCLEQKLLEINVQKITERGNNRADSSIIPYRPHMFSSRESKAKLMNFCENNSSDNESVLDLLTEKVHSRIKDRIMYSSSSSESEQGGEGSSRETDATSISTSILRSQKTLKRKQTELVENSTDLPLPKKEKISTKESISSTAINQICTKPLLNADKPRRLYRECPRKNFICDLCKEAFSDQKELTEHEKKHLACRTCKRRLRDLDIMRQHLEKHCFLNKRKGKPFLKLRRVDNVQSALREHLDAFMNLEKCSKPKTTPPVKQPMIDQSILRPLLCSKRDLVCSTALPNTRHNNSSQINANAKNLRPLPIDNGKNINSSQKNCAVNAINTANNHNKRYTVKFMQIVEPSNSSSSSSSSSQPTPVVTQNNAFIQLENCQNPIYQQKQLLQVDNGNIFVLNPNVSVSAVPGQTPNILYRYVLNNVNPPSSSNLSIPSSTNSTFTNSQLQQPGNVMQIVGSSPLTQLTNTNNTLITLPHQDHSYHQVPLFQVADSGTSNSNQSTSSTNTVSQIFNGKPSTVTQNSNPAPVQNINPLPLPNINPPPLQSIPPLPPLHSINSPALQNLNPPPLQNINSAPPNINPPAPGQFRIRVKNIKELS